MLSERCPRLWPTSDTRSRSFFPSTGKPFLDNPQVVIPSITVPFDDRYRFCSVLDGGKRSGVQFYFIDYPPFFDRDGSLWNSAGRLSR